MSLDNLPPEVLVDGIFSNLGINDLLRMRRVSTDMQMNVHGRPLNRSVSKKVYHIGHDDNYVNQDNEGGSWNRYDFIAMEDFLALELKIIPHRFNFDFRSEDNPFTDGEWKMGQFLQAYGNALTHLTLSELTLPLQDKREINFFQTVAASLCYLSVDTLRFNKAEKEDEARAIPPLQNLTTLKVRSLDVNRGSEIADLEYFWTVVAACENLVTFYWPSTFLICTHHLETDQDFLDLGYQNLGYLMDERLLPNLKTYNINELLFFDADLAGTGTFHHLCETMMRHGVKLEDAHCRSFEWTDNQQELQTIASVIVSMHEYTLTRGGVEFPILERLVIDTNISCAGNVERGARFIVPQWAALKSIKLYINSNVLDDGINTGYLFRILFQEIRRPSVEFLELSKGEYMSGFPFRLPSLQHVAWCCTNLKVLTIHQWEATDEEYSNLWRSLPNLESLTINDCPGMGIGAFIGRNEDEPAFLQLEKLKTLRFIKVQNMRFLTDHLFKIVFCHIRLREFILDGYTDTFTNAQEHVTSFTQTGIVSLLFSHFADTIEVFPFKSWKLRGFTRARMLELGKLFRSAYML